MMTILKNLIGRRCQRVGIQFLPAVASPAADRRLPGVFCLALAFMLGLVQTSPAFPPGPNALIYGMVKDQYGTPLRAGAQVLLQTPGGVQVAGNIQPGLAVGVNYAVSVPMDAGVSGGAYTANALVAKAAYKLYVVIGTTTNLPLEMVRGYSAIGIPASQTNQNLTVGVDGNGDGIPDEWETVFLAQVGTNLNLAQINTNADYAHDGRTMWQEYLLGNYPFNPGDNFSVRLISQQAGSAVLAFTTMTGRAYGVTASADLQNWTPVAFTIPASGPTPMTAYTAPDIQPLQIQTVAPADGPTVKFFRLQLQ